MGSGVDSNTVVAFVGDHGWHLGEQGEWCKRTNWELAVRVPFMIRSPKHPDSAGKSTAVLAELVDLYRTLASLAGAGSVEDGVEGVDLSPVFGSTGSVNRSVVFSQMARCPVTGLGPRSDCNNVARDNIKYMGFTARDDTWRYTIWLRFNGTSN